jgi:hypothetical protein
MTALVIALALMTTPVEAPVATAPTTNSQSPTDVERGEPLPPGAPSEPYELTAFCYGALGEWLAIYPQVIPDLQTINRTFGGHNETRPYSEDVTAGRLAFERWGAAMQAAEHASSGPIATRGAAAVQRGRAIWTVAQRGTRRQLARAWMYWGIPDRCDTVAHELLQRSSARMASQRHTPPGSPDETASVPAAAQLAPLTTPPPSTGPAAGSIVAPTFAAPANAPEVGAPLEVPTPAARSEAHAGASAVLAGPLPQARVIEDTPNSSPPAPAAHANTPGHVVRVPRARTPAGAAAVPAPPPAAPRDAPASATPAPTPASTSDQPAGPIF